MNRDELLKFLLWLYRTEDGKDERPVCENLIDMYCKETGINLNSYIDIIDGLKMMSNNYIVYDSNYVIPKSVLDMYIEYIENSLIIR